MSAHGSIDGREARAHVALSAGTKPHPAGMRPLGCSHEGSWSMPSTLMAARASPRPSRASDGDVATSLIRPARAFMPPGSSLTLGSMSPHGSRSQGSWPRPRASWAFPSAVPAIDRASSARQTASMTAESADRGIGQSSKAEDKDLEDARSRHEDRPSPSRRRARYPTPVEETACARHEPSQGPAIAPLSDFFIYFKYRTPSRTVFPVRNRCSDPVVRAARSLTRREPP
jgi:hypothetical protein